MNHKLLRNKFFRLRKIVMNDIEEFYNSKIFGAVVLDRIFLSLQNSILPIDENCLVVD